MKTKKYKDLYRVKTIKNNMFMLEKRKFRIFWVAILEERQTDGKKLQTICTELNNTEKSLHRQHQNDKEDRRIYGKFDKKIKTIKS